MKNNRVLITGGAGFIGSFLTDKLLNDGYIVRIFDNLEHQVHNGKFPSYINPDAEFIKGDVKDYNSFKNALKDIDIVFHLAASVGVGQSNYEIKKYTDTNIGGMANLLDIIINSKLPIKKIVMTASMTGYGEGYGVCIDHGLVKPLIRSVEQLRKKDWDLHCPECQKVLTSHSTNENSPVGNSSIYALTKNVQETMLMLFGKMYKIPTVSFRCFNVYGPRQSLSNPYTGVTAIFLSRLKNNNQPVIYEDGQQTRDFISVHDVVEALVLSLKSADADYEIFNLGSGMPTSIKDIAFLLAKLLGKKIDPKISGEFRINDIKHCFADISKVEKILGWRPKVTLPKGFNELIEWSKSEVADDNFALAESKMKENKLI